MNILQEKQVAKLPDSDLNACLCLLMEPARPLYYHSGGYYHSVEEAALKQYATNYFERLDEVQAKLLGSGYGFSLSCKTGWSRKAPLSFYRHQAVVWLFENDRQRVQVTLRHYEPSAIALKRAFVLAVVKFNCGLLIFGTAGEIRSLAKTMVAPEAGIRLL